MVTPLPKMLLRLRLAGAVHVRRVWPYVWWFPCQKYRIYTVRLGLAKAVHVRRVWPYVWWFPCQIYRMYTVRLGLAKTVYGHRIWPYVWWFPCQKYRIYTVYTYKCMVLANPTHNTLCDFNHLCDQTSVHSKVIKFILSRSLGWVDPYLQKVTFMQVATYTYTCIYTYTC